MVGFALSRSISDSIDFDTPAARDRSSSVILRSPRRRWICSPTRGGAATAEPGAPIPVAPVAAADAAALREPRDARDARDPRGDSELAIY
ncbi:hypothetical protein PBS_23320 [Paraburkholderia sp. 2C]